MVLLDVTQGAGAVVSATFLELFRRLVTGHIQRRLSGVGLRVAARI